MIIDADYLSRAFDKRRIAQLSDDGDGADAQIVVQVISAAAGHVSNRLSLQYATAEIEANEGIKNIVAVRAMYLLELRRSDVTVEIARLYAESEIMLQQLVDGESKLTEVQQVLPRITPESADDVYEESAYFEGLT